MHNSIESFGSERAHFDGEAVTPPPLVYAQMERILTSPTFVRSKRLGRFLRFTVEQYLQGKQGSLKEYLVGVEVFNKQETFDPRIDSIVRVEARRLRSKLDRYYATDGREDHLVIQFRKGSYVPAILTREQMKALGLAVSAPSAGARSVAVSRFMNLGMSPAHDYFCSGLAEDVISALTKLPGIRIIARQAASTAAEVTTDFILEGSVREQGERFRISAQLINTANQTYLWSETYERTVVDAFAVQDEISQAIVSALRHELQVAA